ncbi:ROK family protein [Glaciihabitans sp. UYNi722]|uniref:ROK family protein n=1 Tax=Glaciihabitans sp. UYNi722 TaxID=3156344 RepID=UPI003395CD15
MSVTSAVLAVDLGGTSMKGAVVDAAGRTVHEEARPTPVGGDLVIEAVGDLLVALRERGESLGLRIVAGSVVSPGTIDDSTGVIGYASNLDWRDVPLGSLMAERAGVPVAIGHDVRAAGLAEQLLGAAGGVDDFVHVAIGTGVAAALFDSGTVLRGATSSPGELGHIPVIADGETCTCGQRGCLEVYMSGAGLARRYQARGGEPRDAEQIVARLGSDPIADAVWAEAVHALALGLATVTQLLDPALVVLGGGLSRAGNTLLDPLRIALDAQLTWRPAPRIALSTLGSDAGRIGASVLAFRSIGLGDVVTRWHREGVLAS